MNEERRELLSSVLEMMELKEVPRLGWVVRGVRDGETVAAHCFSVALLVTILARETDLDSSKALKIAVLHDLAESVMTDIPAPAVDFLGEETKEKAEEEILKRLLRAVDGKDELLELWREFRDRSTPEGRFVRALDKLDMFLQAFQYEREGNRRLERFWSWSDNLKDMDFPVVRALYRELKLLRAQTLEREEDS